MTKDEKTITVTDKEWKLLEEIRKVPYGNMEVVMVNGVPDRIILIRESKKL